MLIVAAILANWQSDYLSSLDVVALDKGGKGGRLLRKEMGVLVEEDMQIPGILGMLGKLGDLSTS